MYKDVVTVYGQHTLSSKSTGRQQLAYSVKFNRRPIVIMSTTVYINATHYTVDIHMLSYTSIKKDTYDGISDEYFWIITHKAHMGDIVVNWVATGTPSADQEWPSPN